MLEIKLSYLILSYLNSTYRITIGTLKFEHSIFVTLLPFVPESLNHANQYLPLPTPPPIHCLLGAVLRDGRPSQDWLCRSIVSSYSGPTQCYIRGLWTHGSWIDLIGI